MIISLSTYSIQLPIVKRYIELHPNATHKELARALIVYTGCPAIVVHHFIGKCKGYTEEVNESIKNLIEFYNYDGVVE